MEAGSELRGVKWPPTSVRRAASDHGRCVVVIHDALGVTHDLDGVTGLCRAQAARSLRRCDGALAGLLETLGGRPPV